MKRRLISFGMVLLLVFFVLMGTGWPFPVTKQTIQTTAQDVGSTSQPSGEAAAKFELNKTEQQIMQKIGAVPYITDVLFDQALDGGLILSAVAEIGTSTEADKKQLARNIAYQFTLAAFQTGVLVAEASIHITEHNQLILGTSLNGDAQKKMPLSAMTGAGASEFIQYLKQHQNQSTEPGHSTFYYETE